ncbi:P-loop containing nucleoside triphosphate hydrolase protein, partial [Cryphonectria parasitica EP155]
GKGLVLLLHGPPGVGKTLTAETVARATGKPLFVVSVAEIGLDASRAEQKLEKIFSLATKWQAVLLIDEADVFLETRNRFSPPQRNALVSVLLRVLEYYEGIIMMTTNRIKAIDVAVISRIHLAVRYTDLGAVEMRNIFKYYLNQLRPDLIHNLEEIMNFIDTFGHMYNLNGRQIRNVVMAAQAYA